MADKVAEQIETPVEKTEKVLKEKNVEETVEAEEKTEETETTEETKENGEVEKETNGKDATNGCTPVAEEDKCSIKRKSTGGESEETPAEEVIPEKKAKLDEEAPQEAENGGAEVAA